MDILNRLRAAPSPITDADGYVRLDRSRFSWQLTRSEKLMATLGDGRDRIRTALLLAAGTGKGKIEQHEHALT